MKKIILISLLSTLMCSLCGCNLNNEDDIGGPINGTWKSDDQEIDIYDNRVEITGYYELEGQRLAGVVTPCKLKKIDDKKYQFDCDSYVSEVILKDESTLIVDGNEYTR